MAARLGQYEALIADAELLSQQAHDAAGRPSATVSADYNQATRLMQSDILPDGQEPHQQQRVRAERVLRRREDERGIRRHLGGRPRGAAGRCPGHAAGPAGRSFPAAGQPLARPRDRARDSVHGGGRHAWFYAEYTQAHVARFDSFTSVQALSMAKAVSNDANADESRFIVDPVDAAQYQQAYLDKSQQMVNVGNNVTYAKYLLLLNADIAAYQRNNSDIRFGGFLGQEFRNITFPGERQAAVNSLLTFRVYETDDRILRAMTKTNLAQAIGYDISVTPSDSDGAFNAFAIALQSDININSAAFTQAVADGQSNAGGGFLAVEALSALVIISLVYVGVRSRLAEYRVSR